jgi:anthranilate synthase component 1
MFTPSKEDFLELSKQGNLIPVYREINGDLETPVSAYFKIAHKAKYSFLLESVEGEEKVARYSFLARDPELVIQSKGNRAKILRKNKDRFQPEFSGKVETPLSVIRDVMSRYQFVDIPGLPRFCGGMVGYIGYDVVRFFEKLPHTTKDDLKLPDIFLIVAKNLIIFDHLNHKIKVVSCVKINPKDPAAKKLSAYAGGLKTIDGLIGELTKPLKVKKSTPRRQNDALKVSSNFKKQKFEGIVTKAKQKIRIGDIIQVVLSQRFKIKIKTDPFNIYRALRSINPSPYMFYLQFDKVRLIGSSPELLVRCEEGTVETRPIAGTRPRGKTEKEDSRLMQDLLNDPKEKAEHIMLVDLGRNDLGRVCRKGSVKVSEFMSIEKYSHVMHIVSNVKGNLRPDKDQFDVLQAAFPAGTVSGAPKIRAMEIIDDLETVDRGPYAGCIGYFSFSKNLDTCITIRTIVATGGNAYVQAGAGIVADSNPQREYSETVNKAKAQIMAIELAHKQNE